MGYRAPVTLIAARRVGCAACEHDRRRQEDGTAVEEFLLRPRTSPPNLAVPRTSPSFNRYSYVGNNPLSATDPTGHDSMGTCDADACYHFNLLGDVDGFGASGVFGGAILSMGQWAAAADMFTAAEMFSAQAPSWLGGGGWADCFLNLPNVIGGSVGQGVVGSEGYPSADVGTMNPQGGATFPEAGIGSGGGSIETVVVNAYRGSAPFAVTASDFLDTNNAQYAALDNGVRTDASSRSSVYRLFLVAERKNANANVGHVFLGGIKPGDSREAWGFYPRATGAYDPDRLDGPGRVRSDLSLFDMALAGDKNFAMQEFDVDRATYMQAMGYMRGYDSWNYYDLGRDNCITAAFASLNAAKIGSYFYVPGQTPNDVYNAIHGGD